MAKPARGRAQDGIPCDGRLPGYLQQLVVPELLDGMLAELRGEVVVPATRLSRKKKRLEGVREDAQTFAHRGPLSLRVYRPLAQEREKGIVQRELHAHFVAIEQTLE